MSTDLMQNSSNNGTTVFSEEEKVLFEDKYRILLKLLNKILKNIQKEKHVPIKKVEDFKDIFGKDIRNNEIEKIRETIDNEIVAYFDKEKIKYNHRGSRKFYTFCCVGFLAEDLGYSFERTNVKGITRKINGEYKKFTLSYYSILKK
jgi:hypothetical protein